MSVVIETLVFCDDCGHQNSGDDRSLNAKQIRASRKRSGWIQIGSKDYCDKCAPLHSGLLQPKGGGCVMRARCRE